MNLDLSSLKRLAPSMRWVIGITFAAVIVSGLVIGFGVRTQLAALRAVNAEIAQRNATASQMQSDISKADLQKKATAKAFADLDTLSASGVIEPLLGSFAMRSKSLLDPIAQRAGFHIDSVRELTPITLQLPQPPPGQVHYRQPIEFTGQGSYAQITTFISQTENTYPMTMLSSLLILSQPQNPETHRAIITFEWPVRGEKPKGLTNGTKK